ILQNAIFNLLFNQRVTTILRLNYSQRVCISLSLWVRVSATDRTIKYPLAKPLFPRYTPFIH
ncbi:hypothetical protein KGY84_01905, partial [Enterobacter roggenkampii]|uniref:hypothetical protein n=1 Tax=Enterobacter roggenkampii TaxID=1812935 RepID=UPI0020924B85